MDSYDKISILLTELFNNPIKFDKQGKAFQLLNYCLQVRSLDSIKHLLKSENVYIRKAGIFVAGEFGSGAASVLDLIIPLIYDENKHTQWYALESVAVCSIGHNTHKFAHVIKEIDRDHHNDPLGRLAIRLTANVDIKKIEAALKNCGTGKVLDDRHVFYINHLFDIDLDKVDRMLESEDSMMQKYGLVALRRIWKHQRDIEIDSNKYKKYLDYIT